ncbi:AAA family ATPase [Lysobacter sp. OAE881]|uniref:ATP-dependent nuclease n=1 Tax=Lysobacter sp. OAE881 TaxID=2663813 RepID=UPI00178BBF04
MTQIQDKLTKLVRHKKMGPYIEHIRFPFYKSIKPGTRIDFTYPITALVGPNGTNKSSVLRAIMGCPDGSNLGNYWFATKLDPIADDENNRPAFIHGHFNEHHDGVVEVLKLRISREDDPNYWEPSRPIRRYGMERMPELDPKKPMPPGRTKTRWNPVDKKVIYLDFRSMLSAFDKFFYHGDMAKRTLSQSARRELIVNRAPHLKAVVEGGLTSYEFHKVERVLSNVELPGAVVEIIGRILGKKYESIRLVEHAFFNTVGYSAILGTANRKYSEAFAGSGEFAVVMSVYQIMEKAQPNSLILMDEPEVSLHPGAQKRLIQFIESEVDKNRHQVVISTHSPGIVRLLPRHAVKVFAELPTGEVFIPTQEATHAEAFFRLGEPLDDKKYLVVEDRLSSEIVKKVLRDAGDAYMAKFEVTSYPGGAASLWKRFVPVFAAEERDDVLVVLDGDQRPGSPIPDPTSIPASSNPALGDVIKAFTGCEIEFAIDGGALGGDKEQLYQVQRQFIAWARGNVRYLPGEVAPEVFILSKMAGAVPMTAAEAKDECVRRTADALGLSATESPNGNEIFHWQRTVLASIATSEPELVALRQMLDDL